MSMILDEDLNQKYVLEDWNPQRVKVRVCRSAYYDSSLTVGVQESDSSREIQNSNITPVLQKVFAAKSKEDVFLAGVTALEWLKKTSPEHRKLYLSGFARSLKEQSGLMEAITPNMIVALEILTSFKSNAVIDIFLDEIKKRPLSEEHLYLVGLCHDLTFSAEQSDKRAQIADEISKILNESLHAQQADQWHPHVVVEAARVLAKFAPETLINQCRPNLFDAGELEMTAVLDAFLVAASTAEGQVDLAIWEGTVASLWQKYLERPQLANAEGVWAKLLNFYLLSGETAAQVIARAKDLPNSTDVLYLVGIEGPKTNVQAQLADFYKYVIGQLIKEGQSKALSRMWPNLLKFDIKTNEFLNVTN
jgi:hypothetical protein